MVNILPVFYLAPIEYYSVLLKSSSVIFEINEHFEKQTYRNRCEIYGANGKLKLIIPVKHTGERTLVKDVRIANENNWQKIHWKSIESAYRTSSYFEFYEHIFVPFYEQKFNFLIDFNIELQNEILKIMEAEIKIEKTNSYQKNYSDEKDLRNYFNPKSEIRPVPHSSGNLKYKNYPQVFSDKFGFISNLSILDLIFNTGPQTKDYL